MIQTSDKRIGVGSLVVNAPISGVLEGNIWCQSAFVGKKDLSHEVAGEVLDALCSFAEIDEDAGWFTFDQRDVAWFGTGADTFHDQLAVEHSTYTENTHHHGGALWIAPSERPAIEAVVMAGQPHRSKATLKRATVGLVTSDGPAFPRTTFPDALPDAAGFKFDLPESEEHDAVLGDWGTYEHPIGEAATSADLDEDLWPRPIEATDGPDGVPEVLGTNPYYMNERELAFDLPGSIDEWQPHPEYIAGYECLRYRAADPKIPPEAFVEADRLRIERFVVRNLSMFTNGFGATGVEAIVSPVSL